MSIVGDCGLYAESSYGIMVAKGRREVLLTVNEKYFKMGMRGKADFLIVKILLFREN